MPRFRILFLYLLLMMLFFASCAGHQYPEVAWGESVAIIQPDEPEDDIYTDEIYTHEGNDIDETGSHITPGSLVTADISSIDNYEELYTYCGYYDWPGYDTEPCIYHTYCPRYYGYCEYRCCECCMYYNYEAEPRPMVALTFDDGPSPLTDYILNILDEHGGHVTFCVLATVWSFGRKLLYEWSNPAMRCLGIPGITGSLVGLTRSALPNKFLIQARR